MRTKANYLNRTNNEPCRNIVSLASTNQFQDTGLVIQQQKRLDIIKFEQTFIFEKIHSLMVISKLLKCENT